ncbi:hypothetical protein BKA70DRAFT_1430412 [Coprinopsis sp. MPI-PUGE-AT-0042]|nr:hypothetical protein BKA70DRAFT_1430412 [Coprinopsis sp. MPI-PUGE-AT-0042]
MQEEQWHQAQGFIEKPATLNHYPADTSNNRFPPGSLNEFTRCIGHDTSTCRPNPYSFPTFKKLTRLTMGTSPLEGCEQRRRRKARRAAKGCCWGNGVAELYEVDDWDGFEIYTNRTDPFVDFFKWTNLPLGLDIEEDWDDMLDRYAATGGEVDDETGYRINEEEEDYLHETHQRRDNEIPVSSVQLQAVFISYLLPTASVPTPHQETRGRAPSRGQRSNIERIRGPNGREILALPAPPSFSPTPIFPTTTTTPVPVVHSEVFTLEAGVIWLPPPTPSSSILCSMLHSSLRRMGQAQLSHPDALLRSRE